MKLLVQADDYGFTKGVTYGIIEGIDNGVITSTGVFTNMEIAPWAAGFIKERPDFCFGIDFNLVAGPSVSDPKEIPDLVDENGRFPSSKVRVNNELWKTKDGQNTLFPFDEVYKEYCAQFERFIALTGQRPKYLNGHSIMTDTMIEAMHRIGKEEDLPITFDYMSKFFCTFFEFQDEEEDDVSVTKVFNAEVQIRKSPLNKFKKHKDELLKHEYVLIGGHPGYVDADLFNMTSLSIERCKDLELVTSKWLKDFIKENDIELVSYADVFELFGRL